LILFGTVDLSASSGPVFSNLVSYAERDAVTVVGRDSYLGAFANLTSLQAAYPATAPTQQKNNDIALATVGIAGVPTWYRWDSTSEAFVAFGAYANEIADLNAHLSNNDIHVTTQQKAALVGSYGSPSSANTYVTENDPVRVLSTTERAAISNAVGIGSGLSETNPLVADGLGVVSHILIQKVADGSNVAALTPESFGDFPAVIYVGRQGIDGTGRSSACQYFSIEDLFGDGLAPTTGGVESPVTITNVNWNATSGATLNPASNSQVDAAGFLTINPGQTLYLNLNINVPLSTQFNMRLNAKGRVRDLAPNWNNPVSFPARTAATAFRKGREPFVLANTGLFKSFRVGDSAKANVFIDADQSGYPAYGNIRFGFYSGAVAPENLRCLLRVSASSSSAFDLNTDNLYLRFGVTPTWESAYLQASASSDTMFVARTVVGVPNAAVDMAQRPQKYILDNTNGVIRASSSSDSLGLGNEPAFTFVMNTGVGFGMVPEYAVSDPGGTTTYMDVCHIRSSSSALGDIRRFDVLLLRNPDSDFDSEALTNRSAFALHKSTTSSNSSGTYTIWATSDYGGTLHNVVAIAANSGKAPNPIAYFASNNIYTLSDVRSTVTGAIKFSEKIIAATSVAVGSELHVKGVMHTYSGLNNTSTPAIGFNVYDGAAYIFGVAATLTNSLPLRLNDDTLYGLAIYARDNTGVLRNSLAVGVSDAILLSYATVGAVRFGSFGYQLHWNKETPSSAICPHLVIEESNTATRELIIGRRAAGGGTFDYTSAIRVFNGMLTLPYLADTSPILSIGGVVFTVTATNVMTMQNGAHYMSITDTGIDVGRTGLDGASEVIFSDYGSIRAYNGTLRFMLGADTMYFEGAAGNRSFSPGVDIGMNLGSESKRYNFGHFANLVTAKQFVSSEILPTANTVNIGSSSLPFLMSYSHNWSTDAFISESMDYGGVNAIRPKVNNSGHIGTASHMIETVWAGTHVGVSFMAHDASSVIGGGTPFQSAYITNITSNAIAASGDNAHIGSSSKPFVTSYLTNVISNTISASGASSGVGSLAAPFNHGWFNNISYDYVSSSTYHRRLTINPTDSANNAFNLNFTDVSKAFDTILLDIEFTTTNNTAAYKAKPLSSTQTQCWVELPNAASFCSAATNVEVGEDLGGASFSGRVLTVVVRTHITYSGIAMIAQSIGIGIDKNYSEFGDNYIELSLTEDNVVGYHIHTLKLQAVPNVELNISPYGLTTAAGWTCVEYTKSDRASYRPRP
jgi:hypothetical protein